MNATTLPRQSDTVKSGIIPPSHDDLPGYWSLGWDDDDPDVRCTDAGDGRVSVSVAHNHKRIERTLDPHDPGSAGDLIKTVAETWDAGVAANFASRFNDYVKNGGEEPNSETDSEVADSQKPLSLGELLDGFTQLRLPIIHELLRIGETMNLIASAKRGKTYLTYQIAYAVATGSRLFGRFNCERRRVLMVDNELHRETIADRLRKSAEALGLAFDDELRSQIDVLVCRGRLRDIDSMGELFQQINQGDYGLVVIDALYRVLPADTDENSNGDMARVYNTIDKYAEQMGCAFILVHHASKGSQTFKSVTDVGSGAGSQSRAADSHLVLREHEEEGAIVLQCAPRSFPPVKPICLRWDYPLWHADESLDPANLKESGRKRAVAKEEKRLDLDGFVRGFIREAPQTSDSILVAAKQAGIKQNDAKQMLHAAVDQGKAHRWVFGQKQKEKFATVQQPLIEGAPPEKPKCRSKK